MNSITVVNKIIEKIGLVRNAKKLTSDVLVMTNKEIKNIHWIINANPENFRLLQLLKNFLFNSILSKENLYIKICIGAKIPNEINTGKNEIKFKVTIPA